VPLDADAHAGLLLVDGRRQPRTPSGLPRLLTDLRAWLDARTDDDAARRGVVLVEWW
jgi:hypothetical protein